MKTWMLALTLATTAVLAQSVDPCTGVKSDAPPVSTPLALPLTCVSEKGRSKSANGAGPIGWRYCLDKVKKVYRPQVVVATWKEMATVPGLAEDIFMAGFNADDATMGRLLTKYVPLLGKFEDEAHAAVWCPFRERIAAGLPPPPPWTTVGLGSTPAYRSNGKALVGSVGSVSSGLQCDCKAPLLVGMNTFCTIKGAPATIVAQCAQK